MRWVALVMLVSACATAPVARKKRAEPERAPREQVERLLHTAYSALEAGDADKARAVFTEDVFVIGLAPSEVITSREDFLDQLRQQLLPIGLRGDVVRVAKSNVRAALAPGGASAWVWDLPVVEHERRGETTVWLPRLTAHALKVDGAWRIDALHVSLGVPDADVWAPDAAHTFLTPAELKEDRGKDSDELIGLSRRLTEDVAVKVERVTDAPEALLLGTDAMEVFIGGKRFKELVRPAIAQVKKSGFSSKIEGPMHSRLSPDGKSAWVAANVVLRRQSGKKLVTCTPFRALWVFVEENGQWNLATEHVSLALREAQRKQSTAEQRKALAAMIEAAPRPNAAPQPQEPGLRRDLKGDKASRPAADEASGQAEGATAPPARSAPPVGEGDAPMKAW